jgi:valyl-tRNA synthetase
VVEARNFCNKLWNIARYVESKVKTGEGGQIPSPSSPADHWVLNRLDRAKSKLESLLEKYEFSEAYETIYHLIWDDVADWYIEASKAHPFAPFVTETIWQTLYPKTETMLISQVWTDVIGYDAAKADDFEKLKSIITETRHIKTILNASGGNLMHNKSKIIDENSQLVKKLAGLDAVKSQDHASGIALTQNNEKCSLDLGKENAKKLLESLNEREEKLNKSIQTLKERLGNKNYLSKAPEKLVQETKHQLKIAEAELDKTQTLIKDYS